MYIKYDKKGSLEFIEEYNPNDGIRKKKYIFNPTTGKLIDTIDYAEKEIVKSPNFHDYDTNTNELHEQILKLHKHDI